MDHPFCSGQSDTILAQHIQMGCNRTILESKDSFIEQRRQIRYNDAQLPVTKDSQGKS
jgi:hypothetical protein